MDWSLNPRGHVGLDLVGNRRWPKTAGMTDAEGLYATRGFLGDCEITVTAGERSQMLPMTQVREGNEIVVTLE
jgi:hypothetical protein